MALHWERLHPAQLFCNHCLRRQGDFQGVPVSCEYQGEPREECGAAATKSLLRWVQPGSPHPPSCHKGLKGSRKQGVNPVPSTEPVPPRHASSPLSPHLQSVRLEEGATPPLPRREV
ncbi:hypothetical protein DPEC_G00360680 [Dallia pectoralis]|uniref:Uncharacterized protein n=1 Tax=Dallia pectoralis TaxID=75939 RepID=A0ACC2F105_DALPE|nr:hypothetical protein DPEC_G00360680 [Dallia pectoralis]